MIRASGAMITSPDGRILFLKRAADSDAPGTWCFPGGCIEDGESAEAAAVRETKEETGGDIDGLIYWTRRAKDGVDFMTFGVKAPKEFQPVLNDEHVAWAWAPPDQAPEPLHPGCRVALDRLTMDELGIARAMAAGELVSPQYYRNVWLFDIRITGTGLAFRSAVKDKKGKVLREGEFAWRDPSLYLNEDFLARCNGLVVLRDHPEEKPVMDHDEFHKRNVGTVFLPYVKGDDVWAIAKIYDDPTARAMATGQLSTSPGVLLKDTDKDRMDLGDKTIILVEGNPALLDHIAVCDAGVWDKGGPPEGVRNDFINDQEPIGMTDEERAAADKARKDQDTKLDALLDALKGVTSQVSGVASRLDAIEADAKARKDSEEAERKDRSRFDSARKDRFGARKDGESFKDWKARHDADESAMCDALMKGDCDEKKARSDAASARKDAEDSERKGDKSFDEWADEEKKEKEHKDSSRKDEDNAEETEKKRREKEDEDAKKDAVAVENADLKARLLHVESLLKGVTSETTQDERDAMARAQARADSVAAQFGDRAPPPIPGERTMAYKKRLLARFQRHSEAFKDSKLDALDDAQLGVMEDRVYADAITAARKPDPARKGALFPREHRDAAGRVITTYDGDNMVWMQHFMTGAQVGKINRNPNHPG